MNAMRWFPRTRGQGPRSTIVGRATAMLFVLLQAVVASAAIEAPTAMQTTPPRLGYIDGEVLFWRPGGGDWEAAQVNLPLAAGDALATRTGKLELQIGGKSFIRVADGSQLRLVSNEPNFVQVEVSAGHAAVDLRELRRRTTVEIDTPNGVVTLAQDGFYRVDVDSGSTRVTVRRGGLASVRPAGGSAAEVGTGEAVEITGTDTGQLVALAAPPFDEWDRWNYERADSYLSAPRSYALSDDIYGADELERNGEWRYVNTYGRVWVPNAVQAGWAPYTNGRWSWDPLYGWSWVDYAPWGWAPFHYGRWVYAGYWAWAPGPVLAAPIYSPALVAFFGVPGISIGVGFGVPAVSWVALGWGEPLIPWWGGAGFYGSPCWWGWGGPRVVNNVVINNNTVINANNVNFYRNTQTPGAVVGVRRDQFDTRSLQSARLSNIKADQLEPLRGNLPGAPHGAQDFTRGGQQAAGMRPEFSRQGPQGAQRAGVDGAAAGRPDTRAAFDSMRGQGTNAARNGSAPNLERSGANASGDMRRGAAPSGATAPRASTDSFNALRNGGSAAAPNGGSPNLSRGQSPPPVANGSVGSTRSFNSLRNGSTGAPAGGAPNLSRGQSAPPVGGSNAAPRSFNRGATSPGNNLTRGQSPPPVPGGSSASTRSFESLRNGGSRSGSVSSAPRSTDMRRGASPPSVQRAPSSVGARSNYNAARGRSSEASGLRGSRPPATTAEAFNRARTSSPQVRQADRAPSMAAPSRRTTTSGSRDSSVSSSGTRQYRATAPSTASAPSSGMRSFSRGSTGGGSSFSRSSGGGFRSGGGGGMSNFGRSMGGGGSSGGMRSMGGGRLSR